MEEDITGDGIREYIILEGYLLSENSNYYTDVWVDIQSSFAQQWKISFPGGYHPILELLDITHDGLVDLIYEFAVKVHGRHFNYILYPLVFYSVYIVELQINTTARVVFIGECI